MGALLLRALVLTPPQARALARLGLSGSGCGPRLRLWCGCGCGAATAVVRLRHRLTWSMRKVPWSVGTAHVMGLVPRIGCFAPCGATNSGDVAKTRPMRP